jgi:cysteine desulfurase family protein
LTDRNKKAEVKAMIYLDQAATSWPKPPGVTEAMKECIEEFGANPGRGGHQLSVRAGQVIDDTRRLAAQLFHVPDPKQVWFYGNATQAINQALLGLLQPGDHVIASSWEHNAVARPLERLRKRGVIDVTWVPPSDRSPIDLTHLKRAIRPETRLIVTTHASNVNGAILPIEEIGEMAEQHQVRFMVDAAQTAGVLPIDVQAMGIHLLAFPGHKGLLGPQGTGGLIVHPDVKIEPLITGGTGSRSEALEQPEDRPEGFESGTPNTPGIAGLHAALQFVMETGIEEIHRQESHLADQLVAGLREIEGVTLYRGSSTDHLPVVSFRVQGVGPDEMAVILDQHYGIAVRAGLHCAAVAHQTLGTLDGGTVRVSPGYFNTEEDVQALISAVQEVSAAFAAM